MTITHHRIAAQTKAPKVWLKRAAERKWSIREMEEAVKGRPAKEEYRAQVERLENSVRRFNETWGTRRNVRVVLAWESEISA